MTLKIIDVAGLKKSGKTTVIENIVSEMSSRGYKVGTVKKIHIPDFTIDHEGKDTYRHKHAGADFVISLAQEEIALIKNLEGQRELSAVMDLIPDNTDFLICEELNEQLNDILYIITLKDLADLDETFQVRAIGNKVLAISGVVSSKNVTFDKYPIIDSTTKDGKKRLVDMIVESK